jgi:hypothetical protein
VEEIGGCVTVCVACDLALSVRLQIRDSEKEVYCGDLIYTYKGQVKQ